ncbi:winged helix DNA-binding domain-containing protein [Prauserella shujinwangii]|uniref:winged helix DNA-binding domain-containing protein n=1 Tax=Prauserella shujinwangii TaxID=1453103 RepID=UPI001FE5BED4|nr:winged helix DNA-binding domain-containing protein [Prauserella shujinwangii]
MNRATLARQLLLRRHPIAPHTAVAALAGLNAQAADHPYLGLWARVEDFRAEQLTELLHARRVVRACLMRYTQHLVTAEDFQVLRPTLRPVLERVQRSAFGRRTRGVDLAELVEVGTKLLRGRTLTRPQLGRLLAERWPEHEPGALAWSFQYLAPVVHPPPDGVWGRRGGHTPMALADDWLGAPTATADPAQVVVRHLAAFGPATVRDVQAWSGLRRLSEVVDSLRSRLAVFHDEQGRELFDLPDAPRPGPDVPAPPRFLPEYDNLLLAHDDRSRVMTREVRSRVCVGAGVAATLLVDGVVRGTWRIRRDGACATLEVEPFEPIGAADRDRVTGEGLRLLAFAAPDADEGRVRLG